MTVDLRALLTLANVTPERPYELFCAHGESTTLNEHTFFGGHTDEDWGPCRITTGTEFDEHVQAELVEAIVNAAPYLLDIVDAARFEAERFSTGNIAAAIAALDAHLAEDDA